MVPSHFKSCLIFICSKGLNCSCMFWSALLPHMHTSKIKKKEANLAYFRERERERDSHKVALCWVQQVVEQLPLQQLSQPHIDSLICTPCTDSQVNGWHESRCYTVKYLLPSMTNAVVYYCIVPAGGRAKSIFCDFCWLLWILWAQPASQPGPSSVYPGCMGGASDLNQTMTLHSQVATEIVTANHYLHSRWGPSKVLQKLLSPECKVIMFTV